MAVAPLLIVANQVLLSHYMVNAAIAAVAAVRAKKHKAKHAHTHTRK